MLTIKKEGNVFTAFVDSSRNQIAQIASAEDDAPPGTMPMTATNLRELFDILAQAGVPVAGQKYKLLEKERPPENTITKRSDTRAKAAAILGEQVAKQAETDSLQTLPEAGKQPASAQQEPAHSGPAPTVASASIEKIERFRDKIAYAYDNASKKNQVALRHKLDVLEELLDEVRVED